MVTGKKPYRTPHVRNLGTREEIDASDAGESLKQAAKDLAEEAGSMAIENREGPDRTSPR